MPLKLKNGTLNFDCPCVDNLPYGPCGDLWKTYIKKKELEQLEDKETQPYFTAWFQCFTSKAKIYMPEIEKVMANSNRQQENQENPKVQSTESVLEDL